MPSPRSSPRRFSSRRRAGDDRRQSSSAGGRRSSARAQQSRQPSRARAEMKTPTVPARSRSRPRPSLRRGRRTSYGASSDSSDCWEEKERKKEEALRAKNGGKGRPTTTASLAGSYNMLDNTKRRRRSSSSRRRGARSRSRAPIGRGRSAAPNRSSEAKSSGRSRDRSRDRGKSAPRGRDNWRDGDGDRKYRDRKSAARDRDEQENRTKGKSAAREPCSSSTSSRQVFAFYNERRGRSRSRPRSRSPRRGEGRVGTTAGASISSSARAAVSANHVDDAVRAAAAAKVMSEFAGPKIMTGPGQSQTAKHVEKRRLADVFGNLDDDEDVRDLAHAKNTSRNQGVKTKLSTGPHTFQESSRKQAVIREGAERRALEGRDNFVHRDAKLEGQTSIFQQHGQLAAGGSCSFGAGFGGASSRSTAAGGGPPTAPAGASNTKAPTSSGARAINIQLENLLAPVTTSSASGRLTGLDPKPTTTSSSNMIPKAGSSKADGSICCYLCRRKFPSLDMLERHCAESKLHRENLAKKAEKEAQKEAARRNGKL